MRGLKEPFHKEFGFVISGMHDIAEKLKSMCNKFSLRLRSISTGFLLGSLHNHAHKQGELRFFNAPNQGPKKMSF